MKVDGEWNTRDPEDHHVYILAFLRNPFLCGPCKIGISKDVQKRLRQVRRDEGDNDIICISVHAFWKRAHAFQVEQAFHRACASSRHHGEWFNLNPADAVVLMARCLNEFTARVLGAVEQDDIEFAQDHFSTPGEMLDFGGPFFPPRRDLQ